MCMKEGRYELYGIGESKWAIQANGACRSPKNGEISVGWGNWWKVSRSYCTQRALKKKALSRRCAVWESEQDSAEGVCGVWETLSTPSSPMPVLSWAERARMERIRQAELSFHTVEYDIGKLLIVRMSYYRCSQGHLSLNLGKVDLRKIVAYHTPTTFSHRKEFCVLWSYEVVWGGEDYLRVSARHTSFSWERVVLFLWVFTAPGRFASGLSGSCYLPFLLPHPIPLLSSLHSDYTWTDSGKAQAVFGEPLTPDMWLVMHGSLDFMFMPKWWGCRGRYGSSLSVLTCFQVVQTLSCLDNTKSK